MRLVVTSLMQIVLCPENFYFYILGKVAVTFTLSYLTEQSGRYIDYYIHTTVSWNVDWETFFPTIARI